MYGSIYTQVLTPALVERSIGPCGLHFRRFAALFRLASTCRVPISHLVFGAPF